MTLHVEDVPLIDVLRFIERNYEGLTYTVTESAVWITAPEKPPLVPRSYPLSRGLVSRSEFQTGVRRTAGRAQQGARGRRGGAAGETASGLAGELARGASARGEGDSFLESVLAWVETWEDEWPEGSTWHVDRQTNTLIVLTTPEMHERIEEVLDILDTVPVQVLVRIKFVEVRADDAKEMGLGFLFLESDTPTDELKLPVGMEYGQLRFQRVFGLNGTKLLLDLKALVEQGRSKVLSAPQIIAMNNTPAIIDISKAFQYATTYEPVSTTTVVERQSVSVPAAFIPSQFEEVNVGFYLEFIPSVGRDMKNIVLDLHSRVDEVLGNITDFQSTPVILPQVGGEDQQDSQTQEYLQQILQGGLANSVQRPVIDAREFRTRLVVEDGGTVVIGGLLKNNREVVTRRVPVLGDIPLLGLLFRYRRERTVQSNLVIVVQAEIVTPSGRRYAREGEGDLFWSAPPAPAARTPGLGPGLDEWVAPVVPELVP
jgi:type II secretory pathway component GspD/PulD (secretin)